MIRRSRYRCLVGSTAGLAAFLAAGTILSSSLSSEGSRTGFFTRTFHALDGGVARCVLFVPYHRPASKLPVILFLNGKGENGDDGLRQVGNNFGGDVWRMRGHFPFLAVCPQCADGGRWTPGGTNATAALAALDQATSDYGGDPGRVYVTGPSAGGEGAMELVAAYPERFAAVVPIATGGPTDRTRFAASGVPCWLFYNGRDDPTLVAAARETRRTLLEAGQSPLVTELNYSGHNAWDIAYESPALFSWLLEQSPANRASAAPFEFLSPKDLLARWDRRGRAAWTAGGDELRAEAATGGDDSLLVSQATTEVAELHFDAYLEASSGTRIVLASADPHAAPLVELVLELPAAGTGGLHDAMGRGLAPPDPAGQRALQPGWNDVRLVRTGSRWRLRLNGWPALDFADPAAGGPVRWGLAAPTAGPAARWRFVRCRTGSTKPLNEDAA